MRMPCRPRQHGAGNPKIIMPVVDIEKERR